MQRPPAKWAAALAALQEVKPAFGAEDDVVEESLKGGINKLISGAAVAFMTSVWGVAFSLLGGAAVE